MVGGSFSETLTSPPTCSRKVSIITGGPGVGKTTIVKALVDVFGKRKLEVQLAAPTGRAILMRGIIEVFSLGTKTP